MHTTHRVQWTPAACAAEGVGNEDRSRRQPHVPDWQPLPSATGQKSGEAWPAEKCSHPPFLLTHSSLAPHRTRLKSRAADRVRALLFQVVYLLFALFTGTAAASTAHVLTIQEAIGPATTDYVVRGLQQAHGSGAALVLLEIDTPGGLDMAMRDIVQAILASPVPVVSYVHPQGARAASAGTFILYASHVAAMAPATTLGAATPVAIGLPGSRPSAAPGPADTPDTGNETGAKEGAQDQPSPALGGDAMSAKQVNDAAAFMRGLAQQHGRNAEWAEQAVRAAASLTAAEALRENVIDLVADSRAELLRQIDGRTVRMAQGEQRLSTQGIHIQLSPPDWRHRLLASITNPSLALVLLMLGVYGLLIEFSSPGFGVSGVVGAICLLLALFALQMLPVNFAGLALILLALALFVAELLSPSFGVLGLGGGVAFVAGGLLLFDRDVPGMGVPLPLIFGLAATSAVVVLLGGGMALRARRSPVVSGQETLLGAQAEVLTADPTQAWALVNGERWSVRSTTHLQAGQRVRVRGIDGLTLQVEPMPQGTTEQGDTT